MSLVEQIAMFVAVSIPSIILAVSADQAAMDPSFIQMLAAGQVLLIGVLVYTNRDELSLFS